MSDKLQFVVTQRQAKAYPISPTFNSKLTCYLILVERFPSFPRLSWAATPVSQLWDCFAKLFRN